MIPGLLVLLLLPLVPVVIYGSAFVSRRIQARTGNTLHEPWVMRGMVALAVAIYLPAAFLLPGLRSASRFDEAEFVDGDLFLHYEVGGRSHDDQIKVIELATGRVKAVKRLTSWHYLAYTILGQHQGQVWLHSVDQGVHRRDAHTAEITLRESDLVARNPQLLAAGFNKTSYNTYWSFDTATGDLCLQTKDSWVVRVDTKTLIGRRLSPTETGCKQEPRRRRAAEASLNVADGQLQFAGSPRSQIVHYGPPDYKNLPVDPRTTWISPAWLSNGWRVPFRFEKGGEALLGSTSDSGKLQVSRVSVEDGRPLWTAPLDSAADNWHEITAVHVTDGRVVVVTLGEVAAFSSVDGARNWDIRY